MIETKRSPRVRFCSHFFFFFFSKVTVRIKRKIHVLGKGEQLYKMFLFLVPEVP